MSNEFKYVYQMASTSLSDIKNIVNTYLEKRKYGKSYNDLIEEYKFRDLLIKPEAKIPDTIKNEDCRKIYVFYFNLKLCQQLIDYVIDYTNKHKEEIEHAEEILVDDIINAFNIIQRDYVNKCILEIEEIVQTDSWPKPSVNFDENMERRVRDFLVMKFLINELTRISTM
ncbi:uncharacterized protein LOC124418842 [Lucilia cuprina]|uniref:uncharacterized protein LOC124418842 n=1 Tax=Lucilia cuprina TaxID=7375 RepID=UPI001F06A640|nr:uncharacterized protein LOC124418842 [Lucilia cuprina]